MHACSCIDFFFLHSQYYSSYFPWQYKPHSREKPKYPTSTALSAHLIFILISWKTYQKKKKKKKNEANKFCFTLMLWPSAKVKEHWGKMIEVNCAITHGRYKKKKKKKKGWNWNGCACPMLKFLPCNMMAEIDNDWLNTSDYTDLSRYVTYMAKKC